MDHARLVALAERYFRHLKTRGFGTRKLDGSLFEDGTLFANASTAGVQAQARF